jgi:hypothetical protein
MNRFPATVSKSLRLFGVALLSGLLLLPGCVEDVSLPDDLIPADEGPAIAIVAPSNSRLLKRAGEQATFTFRLADKEGLQLFRAVPRIFDEKDSLIGDALPIDFQVSGTSISFDFTLTAPALDPYFKVRYACYAIDTKGNSASAACWISILPDPSTPPPFELLSYTGDSIFNSRNNALFAFNFSARKRLPTTPGQNLDTVRLQMDIAENSLSGQGGPDSWKPTLISPSNNFLGFDSVFVMTDASRFNYEAATYQTIYEAFFSDPAPSVQTPALKVGDYVIVRLIKTPRPQFAVMKITRLFYDGPGVAVKDYLRFDYKVTSPL